MIVKHGFYLMLSITYEASLACVSSISDMKCLAVGTIYNETMVDLLGLGCHGLPLQRQERRYIAAISVILLEFLENPANIF